MYSFFINIFNAVIRKFGLLLTFIFSILPDSPFQKYILNNGLITPYIGFVNYFVPVAEMLLIFSAWCIAISIYYAWQVVLRWIKYIE